MNRLNTLVAAGFLAGTLTACTHNDDRDRSTDGVSRTDNYVQGGYQSDSAYRHNPNPPSDARPSDRNNRDDRWRDDGAGTMVSESDVPASVRTTFSRYATSSSLSNYTKKSRNGRTVYESQTTLDGHPYRMCVDQNGNLLSMTRTDTDGGEYR